MACIGVPVLGYLDFQYVHLQVKNEKASVAISNRLDCKMPGLLVCLVWIFVELPRDISINMTLKLALC